MTLPTKSELDAIDMRPVVSKFKNVDEVKFLSMSAGQEHYRLLRWISENYKNSVIAEVGTYMALSTVCLAWEKTNAVISYDVTYDYLKWKERPDNVACILMPPDQNGFPKSIINAGIIFIDTNHYGVMEKNVFDYLIANEWKGVLIYDDIYLNDEMTAAWDYISVEKIDATSIGHVYGTGIIEIK